LLLAHARQQHTLEGAGLVVLDTASLSIMSANAAAERMLGALAPPEADRRGDTPFAVQALARHVRDSTWMGDPITPSVRLCSRDSHWFALHASMLSSADGHEQIAVVIEPAGTRELASMLLDAYGLTPRERETVELVLRGNSTRQIVDTLRISAHTVQDHLKSVFAKFGVGSRRELVAVLSGADHP
jgi:DNA-binding CsgD family transcriptional regulator